MIRQWQGWLSLRPSERWLNIVNAAYRNVSPMGARDASVNELLDFVRLHREPIRQASHVIEMQAMEMKRWWFQLAMRSPWRLKAVSAARACSQRGADVRCDVRVSQKAQGTDSSVSLRGMYEDVPAALADAARWAKVAVE